MEIETYVRFLAALVLVLVLIGGCAWAARRLGLGGALSAAKGSVARLGVVEVKVLDSRRKLVLLRRDAREYLVLLGPNQDLLIESGPGPAPGEASAGDADMGEAGARKTPSAEDPPTPLPLAAP